eukprot:TRINITY_DN55894_c0_g1_i1.p1 TRINITY_DN55894_c0_g1~~TRINITY_DN55894_c0_g1_i1.p1  ORF type:complete len:216 (+),score=19.56 TRINITY_DN55894_c0_g1_i1:212-859(+)
MRSPIVVGTPPVRIYHERQRGAFCALHTLNHVFQEPRFTAAQLDEICRELSPSQQTGLCCDPCGCSCCCRCLWLTNPHRQCFGNYDVNVIEAALLRYQLDLRWVPKAQTPAEAIQQSSPQTEAIILNTSLAPAPIRCGSCVRGVMHWLFGPPRHWYCIRHLGGVWYNLDSRLHEPVPFATDTDLFTWLAETRQKSDGHLLLVLRAAASPASAKSE